MPFSAAIVLSLLAAPPGAAGWQASGNRGAVAAGGMAAVEAGLEILRGGGNAADAAVATILALSVTDAPSFCFGGEVPILVYDARRRVVEALSGQGAAPRLATREHFAAKGGTRGGTPPRTDHPRPPAAAVLSPTAHRGSPPGTRACPRPPR